MGNTEKFLMLFSDFDMVVVEKSTQNEKKPTRIVPNTNTSQTKAELKKRNSTKVIQHRTDWFSKLKNYLQIGFE